MRGGGGAEGRAAGRGEGRRREGEGPGEETGGRRLGKGAGAGPPFTEVASYPRARGPFGRNRLPSRRPYT